MKSDVQERHKKQLSVMRGWLDGSKFYLASDALELVRQSAEGVRKDGITPEFHHQLSVSRLITTLAPHLEYPQETIAAAFLHDLLEDHPNWTQADLSKRFGPIVANAVWVLSKKSGGLSKTSDFYFQELSNCAIGSIVKLADRAHNLQTMQGVFTLEKQVSYIAEVEEYFFPMIRKARRLFPRQYGAYENLKILLRCQVSLIQHIHEAKT